MSGCITTHPYLFFLFIPPICNKMKRFLSVLPLLALPFIAGCHTTPNPPQEEKDPEGTIYYTESDEIFPNPERGFYAHVSYNSSDLNAHASASTIESVRTMTAVSLLLHVYYLTDYIGTVKASDGTDSIVGSEIPQAYLDRMQTNFDAIRNGGSKVIVRFAYKDGYANKQKPWDATPEWVSKHIDAVAPVLQKNADVILCIQAGFIGSWGEWYYTSGFPRNPKTSEQYEPRWQMLDHMLEAFPADRQICLRTPEYKMQYLKDRNLSTDPLTDAEAYQPTAKARLGGHNDCFVSCSNDVGTYRNNVDRTYWEADTRFTMMGGETCNKCAQSEGSNAIDQMERFHWTYLNRDYHKEILNWWMQTKHMDEIQRRLGYRFVLDKAYPTQNPQAGEHFAVVLTLRNVGFAAPVNKRSVELVLVSVADPTKKIVYPQTNIDPRFWFAGETTTTTLHANLDSTLSGEYKVYLNLPDPYASLHDNPAYSIRLANNDIWDENTGYNYLTTITL